MAQEVDEIRATIEEIREKSRRIEESIANVKSAVSSLARSAPQGNITQSRPALAATPTGPIVTFFPGKVTVTTSAAMTGWVSVALDGVPAGASAVLLEIFGGTAADASQPLAEFKVRAFDGGMEVTAKSQRASSAAGDQSGTMAWVPTTGGRFQYLTSDDWAVLEVYAVGYAG